MKRRMLSGLVAMVSVAGLTACEPAVESDGQAQSAVKVDVSPTCGADAGQVLVLVDTSERMELASGYLQGGHLQSRITVVVDVLKNQLPHLKKNADFGLITFPYAGGTDKKGDARVCPTSCAAGAVLAEPGKPYGGIVSNLEHIATGGNAGVGEALRTARNWFNQHGDKTRTQSVLLFTGGTSQCGTDALVEAAALADLGVRVYVMAFANEPDLLIGPMMMAQAGGAPNPATVSGTYLVQPGMDLAIDAMPDRSTPELCNGLDDNCDGQIDENLSESCQTTCGKGHKTCSVGVWSTCTIDQPNPEVCNGVDDNCNGLVDEDFDVGQPCTVANGNCKAFGHKVCSENGKNTVCDAVAVTASAETCDGIDNNCDGRIDEDLTQDCATGCGKGHKVCENGAWSTCVIDQPNPEVCDGIDNDCNGVVDDGLVGDACQTACGSGHKTCSAGVWGGCVVDSPTFELCNGKDDNCNGLVDEDYNVGQPCTVVQGACVGHGHLVCSPDGLEAICEAEVGGGGTELCNGLDDDCDGVIDNGVNLCPKGQTCFKGQCVYD